jgi:hypothetical protein
MGNVESHGKALERHSSSIESALGIFSIVLKVSELGGMYAIVPGDLNEALMSRLLGITEGQWMVCLWALKFITFMKKKGTDELVLTVKVDKIKTLKAQFGLSALEIERSYDSNKQQRWFIRLGKFSDPEEHFTVKL